MPTRVLLIDDHELFLAGLRFVLEKEPEIEIVGVAGTLEAGVELIETTEVDVIVLDLSLPDGEGLDLLPLIREHAPAARVVALSGHQTREWADAALDAGCSGYLDKSVGVIEVGPILHAVRGGRTVVSLATGREPAGKTLARDVPHASPPSADHTDLSADALSTREREVLTRLARGLTNQEAADELFLSVKTVETYRSRLTRKLGVRGRSELFAYAQTRGLLDEAHADEGA